MKDNKPVMRPPVFAFFNSLRKYIRETIELSAPCATTGSKYRNMFFYSGGGKTGQFQKNRRVQMKVNRRRKMKPSAR